MAPFIPVGSIGWGKRNVLRHAMKAIPPLLATCLAILQSGASPATPVNPNATQSAVRVLNYLDRMKSQHKILSGQHCYQTQEMVTHVNDVTGKWPAVIGLDFEYSSMSRLRPTIIANAIDYWRKGGLVTMCWHETNPKDAQPDSGDWSSVQGYMSQQEFDSMVTPGTRLFKKWQAHVDIIAPFLVQLQDSGVVVLWRPYHEMNGDWFWWCGKSGSSFKKLWTNMYDRLTNHWHLNNLLWVWGPFNPVDAQYYDAPHVDIGGFDLYTGNQSDDGWLTQNNALKAAVGSKPIAIAECGLVPDATILQTQTSFTWFLVWAEAWCDNQAYGMPSINGPGNTPDNLRTLYNHPVCITRDEVDLGLTSVNQASQKTGTSSIQLQHPTNTMQAGIYTLTGRRLNGRALKSFKGGIVIAKDHIRPIYMPEK